MKTISVLIQHHAGPTGNVLICKNADAWHVDADKLVLMGFSAGGHLAACAATIAAHKPAAAVLVYPAILRQHRTEKR